MFILFNRKKRYFLGKKWTLQRQIWELEFKKHSTMEIRELIRLDRDRLKESVDALNVELGKEHKDETKKELESRKVVLEDTIGRYEAQMKMLDEEVQGLPYKSPEDVGKQGIDDTIASLMETLKLVESYVKSL